MTTTATAEPCNAPEPELIASPTLPRNAAATKAYAADRALKLQRLRNLRPFILDNSLRETTVASLKGHTLQDKWEIIKSVKFSGIHYFILGSFSTLKRVDDQFVMDMRDKGVICSNCYAFSELRDRVIDGIPDSSLPLGLEKCKAYGVQNAILELDLTCKLTDWKRFLIGTHYCQLFKSRCEWVKANLTLPTRPVPADTFCNIRDMCSAMREVPDRVMTFVKFMAQMDPSLRPMGIMFEEPAGAVLPSELGPMVEVIRECMDKYGWGDGHLLLHVHHNHGLAQAAVLEALASGCNGVWAAVCDEGAATGHAGSLVTLANLVRLGNPHVSKMFNMPKLKEAAIKITEITTGEGPPPRTEVYGPNAGKGADALLSNAADFAGIDKRILHHAKIAEAAAAQGADKVPVGPALPMDKLAPGQDC